jgi:iron complex outermembrane receptor protein
VEPTHLPAGFPQSVLSGSSDFQSEKLIAYELGYRAVITPRVSGSISGFYNQYSDVRSVNITPGGLFSLPFYFANNLEGETHGVELSANYQMLDGWRLRFGYDLLKEYLHVKPGQSDINHGLNETADPQQQFSLRSSMDLPHDVQFDAGLRWVDTLRINNNGVPAGVPSYFELEARLGWQITKRVEVSVTGQNLLHSQHPEYGLAGPTQTEIQRAVFGKIAIRW